MPSILQHWVTELPLQMQFSLLQGIGHSPVNKEALKPTINWMRRCILVSSEDGSAIVTPYDPGNGQYLPSSIEESNMLDAAYAEYYNNTISSGEGMPVGKDVFIAQERDNIMELWPVAMDAWYNIASTGLMEAPTIYSSKVYFAAYILAYKHPTEIIRNSWMDFINHLTAKNPFPKQSESDIDSLFKASNEKSNDQ